MISSTCMTRFCVAATVALAYLNPNAGFAQNAFDRSLDQFTCKQVMREAPAIREATIAFMHGYLLGKSNSMKFNVETVLGHTDRFLDACLDNPSAKAIDIMVKVGG
jgi:HdeA/HdeB family